MVFNYALNLCIDLHKLFVGRWQSDLLQLNDTEIEQRGNHHRTNDEEVHQSPLPAFGFFVLFAATDEVDKHPDGVEQQ